MHYDILYEFKCLESRSCSEIMSKFVGIGLYAGRRTFGSDSILHSALHIVNDDGLLIVLRI